MSNLPDSYENASSADNPPASPMRHPEEPPTGVEGPPRFGRLLLVLAVAVLLIGLLAVGTAAWLGP